MTDAIPILLYHGVDPAEQPPDLAPYVVTPGRFAEHMDLLVARGHRTVTVSDLVDELADGRRPDPGTVLVTFDDGLAGFGSHAWPILTARDIAATLYVACGYVGARAEWLSPLGPPPAMLSWDEICELDLDGCEIGAHSWSHPELDTLTSTELPHEIRDSRVELCMKLGHPVRSFAYPHGYHSRRVKQAVMQAGYDSACAVRNLLSSPDDDLFALARVTIDASCGVDELARILDGDAVGSAPRRQQARTLGWRAYRRTRRRLGAPG